MTLFKKALKIQPVKPPEAKPETPKPEEPVKPTEAEPEIPEALRAYASEWPIALREAAQFRLSNTTIVDNKPYYVLDRAPTLVEGDKTVNTLYAIGEDLNIYKIEQTVTSDKFGVLHNIQNKITRLKSHRYPIERLLEIVQRLIKGEVIF